VEVVAVQITIQPLRQEQQILAAVVAVAGIFRQAEMVVRAAQA
jgi:hypothetical protein